MTTASPRLATRLAPVGLLVLAMISIQTGASLAKQLFPLIGVPATTTLRLVFAAVILLLVLRPWRIRLTADTWRSVLIYGTALGGMNLMFYLSLRSVPLGIAVALEFTGPLAVAICASRKPVDFLWIGLAVAGLLFLLPLGRDTGGIRLQDAGFALGAGVCWALYILYGQKAGADHGTQGAALGVTVAALVVIPFGVIDAGPALFQWTAMPLALAVAVLSTALPYTLEMIALTRLPARTFGTLASLEPAVAAVIGLSFLGEHLAAGQWLAIAAIIGASVGAISTGTPEKAPILDI
ncbi:threonine/homoserine exporter RhtA [Pseudomonas mangiferae]|uniref:Threonine/homoserine exporter RhtA n=1 Tax=Pseudomonas mangiferae TaxID=2593654 RepID=A0A553GY03_9PSED|nr:threonine/homoserine exporter RhtA [Pseudomonas mangiferae]TRX74384.1 threonine/homoserine exporter RhtA [Pseudomonas mangiferae]